MPASSSPKITIVVVPRQQFGILESCLQRLREATRLPFELIVVNFRKDPSEALPDLSKYAGKVLTSDRYLYPYESKNLALEHIDPATRWVVFLDNDVLVHPGWLEKLVAGAEAQDAGAAHPLYLFQRRESTIVHMAHGEFVDGRTPDGQRPVMRLVNQPLEAIEGLEPRGSDFVEFHCWMLRKDVLDRMGSFDPVTVAEHIHHSLVLDSLDAKIQFVPDSVITYVADVDEDPASREYLKFRWSKSAAKRSVAFLCERWPSFAKHWHSKIRAAWEFRSANEAWYPMVGGMVSQAGKLRRAIRPARD